MMVISDKEFRNLLRHFPSGVTIVTIKSNGEDHGLTVSAFCSISPSPPLVAIAIDHKHRAFELLEKKEVIFAVNILAYDQSKLAERFAWVKDEDRFKEGDWITHQSGVKVLNDSLCWMVCNIYSRHVAGTHTIYVGEVFSAKVNRADVEPLVYWNRNYRRLKI